MMDKKNEANITDEFGLIQQMTNKFQTYHSILVPNGDDAAILPPTKMGQVVCTDTMVEEVHFTKQTMSPRQIGYKALAVNLSDIAAMGGIPKFFLVSLAVSPEWQEQELVEIYKGMKELADKWQIDLVGGDTVSSKHHLVLTVTVIGEVEEEVRLLRSNASPGDIVFVTETLGDSAAGLHYLLQGPGQSKRQTGADVQKYISPLLLAHQEPTPHLKEGRILASYGGKQKISLNDVSDGLSSEAHELAESSQVSIVIEKEKIPLSPEILRYAKEVGHDPYDWAFHGGEDFILIGTVAQELFDEIQGSFMAQNRKIFPIGYVEEGQGEVYIEEAGSRTKIEKKGYNHFGT